MPPILNAQSVTKQFGARPLFQDISITVEVMTFPPPFETWKTVATPHFDAPVRKCYELTGETFNVKFVEVACAG